MKLERFRDLLDSRGTAVHRWPAGDRDAARRLLATEPLARQALAEAERLDRLLARLPAPTGQAATARILDSLADLPPQKQPWFHWPRPLRGASLRPLWPQAAAMAAVAMLGILIGASDLDPLRDDAGGSDIGALVFDGDPGTIGLPL